MRWDYEIIRIDNVDEMYELLPAMGEGGWELISTIQLNDDPWMGRLIFKRPRDV